MDVAKLIRLHAAVASAADLPDKLSSARAYALADAYMRLRAEVRGVIDANLRDEFDRLFQELRPTMTAGGAYLRLAAESESAIRRLSGWIDGVVKAATLEDRAQRDAEAYARERVRQERGVGFSG
jgi:hypothetical protein